MVLSRLDPKAGIPLANQLAQQIVHAIETGALPPGARLPALRHAAKSVGVNVNTVARVYRDLERAGMLLLRQGAGAFVTDRVPPESAARLREAGAQVSQLVARLRSTGLTRSEVRRLFEAALAENASQ